MEIDRERAEAVRTLVSTFLEKMTLSAEVVIEKPISLLQGEFVCHIIIPEGSNLLIGQRGVNLDALQLLARLVIRRQYDGWADFSLDVNEYWRKKSMALIDEAQAVAERVVREGASVTLRSMTAFERKCVHMALADSSQVKTESVGIGSERKISVKLKNA